MIKSHKNDNKAIEEKLIDKTLKPEKRMIRNGKKNDTNN